MEKISKLVIIAALSVAFFLIDAHNVSAITMHFAHANIFHLLANCWCVWLIRRAAWIPSYIIAAVVATAFSTHMVGFSGLICAAMGITYGRYPSDRFIWALGIMALTGILPYISAEYHIACLTAGFVIGYIYQIAKLYAQYRNR